MKATQTPLDNIFISIFYCLIGALSFYVLKNALQPSQSLTQQHNKIKQQDKQTYLDEVNYTSAFFKAFVKKYTLPGNCYSRDWKYLLKQFLIISAIAVLCLHINSMILWPVAVAFGVFLLVFVLFQVVLDFLNTQQPNQKVGDSEVQKMRELSRLQIEHTQLQINFSSQRIRPQAQSQKSCEEQQTKSKSSIQLSVIILIGICTALLLCQTILILSVSVSNSGILNLISLACILTIDQLAIRPIFGTVLFAGSMVLHFTEIVKFEKNVIFSTLCRQEIIQQICVFVQQRKQMTSESVKVEYESVKHEIIIESYGCLNFQNMEPSVQNISVQPLQNKQQRLSIQSYAKEFQEDFVQLFEYDLEMFKEQWIDIVRPKAKNIFKSAEKSQSSFDSKLYFPYQQNKKNQFSALLKEQLRTIDIDENLEIQEMHEQVKKAFHGISILEVQQEDNQQKQSSDVIQASPEIGLVLHQMNTNKPISIGKKNMNKDQSIRSYAKKGKHFKQKSAYLVKQEKQLKRPIKTMKRNKENMDFTNSIETENSYVKNLNIQQN